MDCLHYYLCGIVHKIASAILIMAFFGQTFSQAFYYIDYTIDRAAYEKNCINKARPMLHCNGKCQMMKKWAEQEKKNQQIPELRQAAKLELVSPRSLFDFNLNVVLVTTDTHYCVLVTGGPVDQPSSFFHPPGA